MIARIPQVRHWETMIGIFALGSNGSGQLGVGHQDDTCIRTESLFTPPSPKEPVIRVAAGGNHTLLLTQDGQVYSAGQNENGACGPASDRPSNVFSRVELDEEPRGSSGSVTLVAATWEASLIVQKDDSGMNTRLWSIGAGSKGELGLGDSRTATSSAILVPGFPPTGTELVDMHACMDHVVAVLSNGEAYAWGNCRKGQAGEPAGILHSPRKIEGVGFPVVRAVCTKETSVLFGASGSGHIAVLGSDKWSLRSQAPEQVPAWKDVGASWGGIYILTKENRIIAWGRNDHEQLPPPSLPPVDMMAVGSEHVVARTEEGSVVAWGWGEHGNCGQEFGSNSIKGDRYNVIVSESTKQSSSESSVGTIGAGCATSWVYLISGE